MRLYHRLMKQFLPVFLLAFLWAGCAQPEATQVLVNVRITVDGQTAEVQLPAGTTVQQLLTIANVTLNPLDRTDPALFTILKEGSQVKVTRVTEEFSIRQETLPFDKQIIRNESLPEGESRLVQPGTNGIREITERVVFEDGVEVARYQVKAVDIQAAVPEVEMIGSQNPYAPLAFPGRLVYISSGNAWLMETSSGSRKLVVPTGDLDGRIFRLSRDGKWLLYTRSQAEGEDINSLWAANIDEPEQVFDLKVRNVIHFADWVPGVANQVIFSTAEPRTTAPGWQANNDLRTVDFSLSGWVSQPQAVVETNFGGIYGWWGASFAYSPDGSRLLYHRADGIGLVDPGAQNPSTRQQPLYDIVPLQTQGDWAWVPGTTWAPSGNVLFTVAHAAAADVLSQELSPLFDLVAVPLLGGGPITIVPQVGMFAYPTPSPIQLQPGGEQAYQLAFLQAIFPTQSDTSRYRLVVMDRDGSNRRTLFPQEGAPGVDPQQVFWSPQPFGSEQSHWIALLYQGNLWMIDTASGEARQLTGDGLIDRLDWR